MEGKSLAIFALVFVAAAVFVSNTEAVPFPSDAAEAVVAVAAEAAPVDDEAPSSKQGRFYGFGYPGLGYGGLGYNSGSSSAAAAAAAASSSGTGLGYPYGRK